MASESCSRHGVALVIQPGEANAWWQPVPANGYVEVRVSEQQHPSIQGVESGVQVIAPGGHIREHQHNSHHELILMYEGEGVALVDGVEYPLQPGTTVYLGAHHRHKFINTGPQELKFFWVFLPGGLAEFFARIGRRKDSQVAQPEPFSRPDNVAEIERNTVFAPLGS